MKVKISDVAIINKANINNNNKFKQIKYLDTGSIFKGRIDEYKNFTVDKDKIPSRAKRLVTNNTIVYSSVRPRQCHYGILGKPSKNTVVSTGFITIDAISNKINPYYLYYKLTQNKVTEYLASIADTAVSQYPSIKPDDLASLEIDIIENIHDQERIARLFKNIDTRIENNNKMNSELESMAKTIYDYWFLQFEFPNEEGKPYKSSGGKMVWNEELGREIPEGWANSNLYSIANFINGAPCQKYRPLDENFKLPVVKIKEMHNGITSETEYVKGDIDKKYIIDDGNILFSWSATLETMLWNGGKAALNQHIFKVEPLNFPKYYVFMQLQSYIVNFKQMAEARKTTMGHITSDHIKQSRIIIPPINITENFNCKIDFYYRKRMLNDIENRKLASLRDFLLPLLMNGQVKFKEEIDAKNIEVDKEEVLT